MPLTIRRTKPSGILRIAPALRGRDCRGAPSLSRGFWSDRVGKKSAQRAENPNDYLLAVATPILRSFSRACNASLLRG
jgi:hypothetical protein